MVKSFRVVAYEANKNSYQYKNLHYGASIDEAARAAAEIQTKYGEAWVEVSKNGKWVKCEYQLGEPSE